MPLISVDIIIDGSKQFIQLNKEKYDQCDDGNGSGVGNRIKFFWLVDPTVFSRFSFWIKLKIGSLNNQIIKSDLSTFFMIYFSCYSQIMRLNETVEMVKSIALLGLYFVDFLHCQLSKLAFHFIFCLNRELNIGCISKVRSTQHFAVNVWFTVVMHKCTQHQPIGFVWKYMAIMVFMMIHDLGCYKLPAQMWIIEISKNYFYQNMKCPMVAVLVQWGWPRNTPIRMICDIK